MSATAPPITPPEASVALPSDRANGTHLHYSWYSIGRFALAFLLGVSLGRLLFVPVLDESGSPGNQIASTSPHKSPMLAQIQMPNGPDMMPYYMANSCIKKPTFSESDPLRPLFHFGKDTEKLTQCYCHAWFYYINFFRDYRDDAMETFYRLLSGAEVRSAGSSISSSPVLRLDKSDRMFPSDAVIIEVGAGKGTLLRYWMDLVKANTHETQSVRLYLFEPDTDVTDKLQNAVQEAETRMGKKLDIKIFNKVLLDESKKVSFQHSGRRTSPPSAFSRVFYGNPNDIGESMTTVSETLDSYLKTHFLLSSPDASKVAKDKGESPKMNQYPIQILHIGTNGGEFAILQGATTVLPHVRFIVFECSFLVHKRRSGPGISFESTQKLLESNGFMMYKIGSKQWVPVTGSFYHLASDNVDLMFFSYCMAVRYDDPVLPKVHNLFNIFPTCAMDKHT